MKKDFLMKGYVVQLRNGDRYLVLDDYLTNNSRCKSLTTWNDELLHKIRYDLDIIKVFALRPVCLRDIFNDECLDIIWERKESNKIVYLNKVGGNYE